MKTSLIIAALSILFTSSFSQTQPPDSKTETKPEKKVKFELAGQLCVAKDLESNVFINFGGPGLKFSFSKTVAINVGMFPSLRYNYEYNEVTDKTAVSTILGTGAQLSYKRVAAGCMFYLVKNLWYAAPCLAYKFK